MAIICPTVLAETPDAFAEQLAKVFPLSKRVQIDLADGDFAPNKTIPPTRVYIPDGLEADIHLMYRYPVKEVVDLISLKPRMVIMHVEAEGDMHYDMLEFQNVGIKAGLALLPESEPEYFEKLIQQADHVLIFGGTLGAFGGSADLTQLEKVQKIKQINPKLEIGWDGGANADNVLQIANAGVDVVNVGGAIQRAPDAAAAYAALNAIIAKAGSQQPVK